MTSPTHLFSVTDRSLEQLIDFVEHPKPRILAPHADVAVAVELELQLPHLSMIVSEGITCMVGA